MVLSLFAKGFSLFTERSAWPEFRSEIWGSQPVRADPDMLKNNSCFVATTLVSNAEELHEHAGRLRRAARNLPQMLVCDDISVSGTFFGGGGGGSNGRGHSTPWWEVQCLSAMIPWHPDRHASATSPSLLRDDQNLRDNRVTVQWRRAGCRASPYRHPECHANVVRLG